MIALTRSKGGGTAVCTRKVQGVSRTSLLFTIMLLQVQVSTLGLYMYGIGILFIIEKCNKVQGCLAFHDKGNSEKGD